ncbi:MAG: hypothetical protein E7Z89_04360 [Cyanobacteria bacterium SIG28]|nr:hypothetical protein [Cyanobacteria bacterium SIG28]
MKISPINNNQTRITNNTKKQNPTFKGVKEFLNQDITKFLNQQVSPAAVGVGVLGLCAIAGFAGRQSAKLDRETTTNKIGNFINNQDYDKNSLKVVDVTEDGIKDFVLTRQDGSEIVYDAMEDELLEYQTVLTKIEE